VFSVITFVVEVALQGLSAPWWYDERPDGWDVGVWVVELGGVVLDLCFIVKDGVMPENDNDKDMNVIGVTVKECYGIPEILVAGIAVAVSPEPAERWGDVMPSVPGILKIGLYEGIVKRAPYFAVGVAAADIIFFGISAGYLAYQAYLASHPVRPELSARP
jgi:hypothetical protein